MGFIILQENPHVSSSICIFQNHTDLTPGDVFYAKKHISFLLRFFQITKLFMIPLKNAVYIFDGRFMRIFSI